VFERSDGNPYFALEIVASLRDTGRISPAADGSWTLDGDIDAFEIPATLREVVAARLSDLDDDDRETLTVAACCGFEFDPLVVAAALRREPLPVLRRLALVERRHGLVRAAAARYAFDHHVAQETILATTPPALAAALHLRIAEALAAARRPPTPALSFRLADHFLRAGRGELAAPHLADALAHADSALRAAAAVAFADRALATGDALPADVRRRVLFAKAHLLDRIGDPAAMIAALRDAAATVDGANPGERSQVRSELALGLFRAGRYDDAADEARGALADARTSGDARRIEDSEATLGTVLALGGRVNDAREHLEEAARLARLSGDPLRQAEAIAGLVAVHSKEGRTEETLELLQRAVATLSGVEAPRVTVFGLRSNLASALRSCGRDAEAIPLLEDLAALARDAGDRRLEAMVESELAASVAQVRSLAAGKAMLERACVLTARANDPLHATLMQYRLAAMLYRVGSWERALEECERTLDMSRASGLAQGQSGALCLRALLLNVLGDAQGAHADSTAALGIARARRLRWEESHALIALSACGGGAGSAAEAVAFHRSVRNVVPLVLPLVALGDAHAAAGRDGEAHDALSEANEIARSRALAVLTVTTGARLLRFGDADPADVIAGLAAHAALVPRADRMLVQYLLFRATGDPERLRAAHEDLAALSDSAPAPRRQDMISCVPLHAAIEAAWNGARTPR
jgi:tetratricopeptide (TPR) repeat protein